MKKLLAAPALVAIIVAMAMTASAQAASPSTVNISVAQGALKYNQKTLKAKAGVVQINFTNDSTAPHNVALEHGGEFEYGATITIAKSQTTTFLTLAKGTYHVYSSVGTDEDKGMSATLVVS